MKQISLETKIKKILMNTLLPMTVLMVVLLIIVSPVSYTHLTLPTNREV